MGNTLIPNWSLEGNFIDRAGLSDEMWAYQQLHCAINFIDGDFCYFQGKKKNQHK